MNPAPPVTKTRAPARALKSTPDQLEGFNIFAFSGSDPVSKRRARTFLSEDAEQHGTAASTIQSMRHALPSVHTNLRDVDLSDFDLQQHDQNLRSAIREAMASDGFDKADFIRRLCAMELASDREWQQHLEARRAIREVRDAKFDRMTKPLVDTINTSPDEKEKAEAIERFAHVCRAYICGGVHTSGRGSPQLVDADLVCPAEFRFARRRG